MAKLPEYNDFENKRKSFKVEKEKDRFIINSVAEFDELFDFLESEDSDTLKPYNPTAIIYRGNNEAKYKLYNSAQRQWITNNMSEWGSEYFYFITKMVDEAKLNPLLKQVFDLYGYSYDDREFPILSLLQHYGAPTPLMDWTYNKNVALYFALDGLKKDNCDDDSIDNYFSLYRIVKSGQGTELISIFDAPCIKDYKISSFEQFGVISEGSNSNNVFTISDFEGLSIEFGNLKVRAIKPLTTIYNQNILPQEGLFLFNPYAEKPMEDIFNSDFSKLNAEDSFLSRFECYNIHKDLTDYIKRKIAKSGITTEFIYPKLIDHILAIKEHAINKLIV